MLNPQTSAGRGRPRRVRIEANIAGATLSADVREALQSELAVTQLRERIYAVLAGRQPLTISVRGLEHDCESAAVFARFCGVLRVAAADAQVSANTVEVAIEADTLAPQAAWQTRCDVLGTGPLHLLAGDTLLKPQGRSSRPERYEQFWQQLWRLRGAGLVRAACGSVISPSSPLLCTEVADTIQPLVAMQVPAGSAWVSMQVNLMNFADASGRLDETALYRALHDCVDIGDAAHERARWNTPQMRYDAWLNRRLAIDIRGVGDLVMRRGEDPQRFGCLKELIELLGWIQSVVRDRSRWIARSADYVPAIIESDPSRKMLPAKAAEDWCRRWRNAVERCGVRHRNLLALSPWSFFPSRESAGEGYLDLLPLLEFADVCGFGSPPPLRNWGADRFRELHQRAWAILEKKSAQGLFAEQV